MAARIDQITKFHLTKALQAHVDLHGRFTVQSLTEAFQSAWMIANRKPDGSMARCEPATAANYATNFLRTLRRNRQVWSDGGGWPRRWRKGQPSAKQQAGGRSAEPTFNFDDFLLSVVHNQQP